PIPRARRSRAAWPRWSSRPRSALPRSEAHAKSEPHRSEFNARNTERFRTIQHTPSDASRRYMHSGARPGNERRGFFHISIGGVPAWLLATALMMRPVPANAPLEGPVLPFPLPHLDEQRDETTGLPETPWRRGRRAGVRSARRARAAGGQAADDRIFRHHLARPVDPMDCRLRAAAARARPERGP